jgi:hypothetical protein
MVLAFDRNGWLEDVLRVHGVTGVENQPYL